MDGRSAWTTCPLRGLLSVLAVGVALGRPARIDRDSHHTDATLTAAAPMAKRYRDPTAIGCAAADTRASIPRRRTVLLRT